MLHILPNYSFKQVLSKVNKELLKWNYRILEMVINSLKIASSHNSW
jgi:uncharacterized protein YmfQ (DUF2313 family)